MSWPESYSPHILFGLALIPVFILIVWLEIKLNLMPEFLGKRLRRNMILGCMLALGGLGGAWGMYLFWLQKPSADLLTLNLSYRFPAQHWNAGDEVRVQIIYKGGENHAQLLTRVYLRDARENEVSRQERVLGHASDAWESLTIGWRIDKTGDYRVDVMTPGFVKAVDIAKAPAGI